MISGFMSFMVFADNAGNQSTYVDRKPDFERYAVSFTKKSFSTHLILTNEQEGYSEHWKKITMNELKKAANLAGNYRIYTDAGSQGSECLDHKGGVCGWVIDKVSGKVVTSLPSVNGSNVYNQVADNGTPIGEEFKIHTQENSALMILTGQAIPLKIESDEYGLPITYPCKAIYYVFENNQFRKIAEDENGCSVE